MLPLCYASPPMVRHHYLEVDLDVVNVRLGLVPEQGVHGHDDAWGAEAAPGPVRVRHSLLDSMESGPEETQQISHPDNQCFKYCLSFYTLSVFHFEAF